MRKKTIIGLLLVFFLLSGCTSKGIDLYISTSGADTNAGSIEQPFRTLGKAAERIKVLRKNNNKNKIIVYLREGNYMLDSSFVLDSSHNNMYDAPVVFSNYQDEKARIIGGRIIENSLFQKISSEDLPCDLNNPDPEISVYKCDINELNISDLGSIKQFGFSTSIRPAQAELFYNNRPMVLARYPNKGKMAIGDIKDKGPIPFNNEFKEEGGTFHYYGNRPSRWTESPDAWLYGTFSAGYTDNNVHVKHIDTIQRTIATSQPDMFGYQATDSSSEWGGKVRGFYGYNILEELDMPGEYFINKDQGILYVIPPDNGFNKEIAISLITTPLVVLEGASNITFRGIDFEYGRGMGICLVNGANNHIVNCSIRNFGTVGVMFGKGVISPDYPIHEFTGELKTGIVGNIKAHVYENNDFFNYAGNSNTLENCVLSEMGSGGIILSGGDRKTLMPGNNAVIQCEIYNFSNRNKTYCPGIALYGVGNKIENCYIRNGPQQAVAIQGNDHKIARNIIENMAWGTHDNGSIYIGRNPTERGTVIKHNLFYNIGKSGRKACSVHLDDCASGIRVFGNIFYKGSRSDFGDILLNGGNYNQLNNNVFIKGAHALWIENPYNVVRYEYDMRMKPGGLWFDRLYKEIDMNAPVWQTKYPGLSLYKQPVHELPFLENNTFNNNLIINSSLVISKQNLDTSIFYTAANNLTIENDLPEINGHEDVLKKWINELASENIQGFKDIPVQDIGLQEKTSR